MFPQNSIKMVLIFLVALLHDVVATPMLHQASDGNSYLIESEQKYNWLQAADICASQGYQLAVIDSAAKNAPFDALLRNLFANPPNLWLGHHDEFNKEKNTGRPFYAYTTGEKLTFNNWAPNEPNNLNNIEHCVHIYDATNFQWNDMDCKGKFFGYICEKHDLQRQYENDLNAKREDIKEKNNQIASSFENTQNDIKDILKRDHLKTNDILLDFDTSLEDILKKLKESFQEIVKEKPYMEAVIADVRADVKEILNVAHEDIFNASENMRTFVAQINEQTENSINDLNNLLANILEDNFNEVNNILL